MRVTVNADVCIGAGQCYLAAPRTFDLDEDSGTVVLLDEAPRGPDADAAREAERACPSGAITIEGNSGA